MGKNIFSINSFQSQYIIASKSNIILLKKSILNSRKLKRFSSKIYIQNIFEAVVLKTDLELLIRPLPKYSFLLIKCF